MSRWPVEPAAFVADLLDADEAAEAARLMRDDPDFRREVEDLRSVAARLAALPDDAWERSPGPPPLDIAALTPRAGAEPSRARVGARARGGWRARLRPGVLIPITGMAAAVVAALVVWARPDDPATRTIALDPLANSRGSIEIAIAGDTATLTAHELDTTDARHHYEAWLGDASGKMISMGTFRVDARGEATVEMPVTVDLSRYALLDVSLEEDDGNPAHSTKSVFRQTF